jgi:hypothetical protein
MRRGPERIAWAVLYSSLFACCLLSLSTVFGLRWWVLNASVPQTIKMESSGTVLVTRPGRTVSEANLAEIPIDSIVATQGDSQATVIFIAKDGQEILATVQIYGNTQFIVKRADSPRFRANHNTHQIELQVTVGRLRAEINSDATQPVKMQLHSAPDAITVLGIPGSKASLETTLTSSVITVRDGEATVMAQSRGVTVRKAERAEVTPDAPPNGPLHAERDWIVNGDFQQPLDVGWKTDIRPPSIPEEDWGRATIVNLGGRTAVNFSRAGVNWGHVGIVQEINRDVRDYQSLQLRLTLQITFQDIWNCGAVGSECPVMVVIRFIDQNGFEREWVQGFFYKFNANPAFGPPRCSSCAGAGVSGEHQPVTIGEWTTFESQNLLEIFKDADQPAVTIQSISVYAEGHIFDSSVTEVELLALE